MKTNIHTVLVVLITLIYDLLIIFGCGHIVFILGHSGWWFLLAYAFFMVPTQTSTMTSKIADGAKNPEFAEN